MKTSLGMANTVELCDAVVGETLTILTVSVCLMPVVIVAETDVSDAGGQLSGAA